MIFSKQPSNLELQALSVLWREGPSTVGLVHELLPDGRQRAYNTVLAVMQSLERKGLIKHTNSGRANLYQAICSQKKITEFATKKFTINTFGGSLGEAILAILSIGSLTPEEKTNIENELHQHKIMPAKKPTKKAAAKPAAKPAKKAPVKKAPAKKAPAKKAPAKKAPAKKAPAKKAPAKKAPAKKAPAKKAPVKKAPAKKVPAKKAPVKKAK